MYRNIVLILLAYFFYVETLSAKTNNLEIIRSQICSIYLRPYYHSNDIRQQIKYIQATSGTPETTIRELYDYLDDNEVSLFVNSISEQGSWSDIDYQDKSRSGWQPLYHLEKLVVMSKAYNIANSKWYKSLDLKKDILKAIDYWHQGEFICLNWWYNQIGVPKTVGIVYLLMLDHLNERQREEATECMAQAKIAMTGQNRTWLAGNVLIRGLLLGDEPLVLSCRDVLLDEIRVSEATGINRDNISNVVHSINGVQPLLVQPQSIQPKAVPSEGIQPDWSFHQHGAQQQFGNYGLAYINTMSYWARVFHQTDYPFPTDKIDILHNYFVKGISQVICGGYMDFNACGRQLFKSAQRGKTLSLGRAVLNMSVINPSQNKLYDGFMETHIYRTNVSYVNETNIYEAQQKKYKTKYFTYSDMMTHHSTDIFFSLKMSSSRTIGSEIINGENLLGYYMGDGALASYVNGDEYEGVYPVWDWCLVPGVTAYQNDSILNTRKGAYTTNNNDFVGGIVNSYISNGEIVSNGIGMAAMTVTKDGLSANKSYFFAKNEMMALGHNITATLPYDVSTSINQTKKRGAIRSIELENKRMFKHDNIGYVVDTSATITIRDKTQKGNWHRVAKFYDTTNIQLPIFSIAIEHGVEPDNANYCYSIVAGDKLSKIEKLGLTESSIRVVNNDASIQRVIIDDTTECGVVYSSQEIKLLGDAEQKVSLHFDAGAMYMAELKNDGCIILYIVDPTCSTQGIEVSIAGGTITSINSSVDKAIEVLKQKNDDVKLQIKKSEKNRYTFIVQGIEPQKYLIEI